MSSSTISVIGAAIAGPAAALKLSLMGHSVTVYESRQESALFSAGVLGMTRQNWTMLEDVSVSLADSELSNRFTDYVTGTDTVSPFRLIAWTDLHNALVSAARDAGVRFVFEHHVSSPENMPGLSIDATGVSGAARRKLNREYSGYTIYRGLSPIPLSSSARNSNDDGFVTYRKQHGVYFTVASTQTGSAWAYFVKRDEPADLRTIMTSIPTETRLLPTEYRRLVKASPMIIASPMSDWTVPSHMHNRDYSQFTVGDVNGAVRPITTSGANLAVIEGFALDRFVGADTYTILAAESDLLTRRAYDLRIGQLLEGPEIGGEAEDVNFALNHSILFPTDVQS